jgi:hypothetical protein
VADLAAELDGLRLAHPALTDATCNTGQWLPLPAAVMPRQTVQPQLTVGIYTEQQQHTAPQRLPHHWDEFRFRLLRADGSLSLSFVNLDAEVKFAVSLRLPGSYPAGPVQQQARIWFGGELAAGVRQQAGWRLAVDESACGRACAKLRCPWEYAALAPD